MTAPEETSEYDATLIRMTALSIAANDSCSKLDALRSLLAEAPEEEDPPNVRAEAARRFLVAEIAREELQEEARVAANQQEENET